MGGVFVFVFMRGVGAKQQCFRVHKRGGWVLMFGLLCLQGVGMDRHQMFRVSAFPRSGGWALNDGIYAFVIGTETHPQAF